MRPTSAADPHVVSGAVPAAFSVKLLPLGDTAWTVEYGDRIDPALYARVQGLAVALAARRAEVAATPWAAIVDVVPTFRSLSVHYDPLRVDGADLGEALLALAADADTATSAGRAWRIPVCFDTELAPGLGGELRWRSRMAHLPASHVQTRADTLGVWLVRGGVPEFVPLPQAQAGRAVAVDWPLETQVVDDGRFALGLALRAEGAGEAPGAGPDPGEAGDTRGAER